MEESCWVGRVVMSMPCCWGEGEEEGLGMVVAILGGGVMIVGRGER